MVREKLKHIVIDFEPISERLRKLRIRGRYRKISIVNVHAPTGAKENEAKESFYEELSRIINNISRYDIKILVGDLIIKAGKEEMHKHITRGHSKHEYSNDNGKILSNLLLK